MKQRCTNCGHEVKRYHGKWYHSQGYLVHNLTLKCSNCDCRTPDAIKPYREWFVIKFWNKIKYHLNKKSYYNRFSFDKFFNNLVWMVILSLTFAILYSNIDVINKIVILFPLGNILLLINGIFWIKYAYQLLKGVFYWYGDQRNWMKYLIVLIILSLAWQSYQQKETIFNPLIDFTNKNPVKFDLEKEVVGWWNENKTNSWIFDSPKIDSNWVHNFISIVNNERAKKGLTALKESNDLDNIATARFKKMMEKPMVSHYGADEYNVGEVVFYPTGFTEQAYADDIQKNAPLHWNLLMDSSFSAYGFHIGEGDAIEVYQPCSITEIPGPNIDVKEFFRKRGCSTTVEKSTWLVIEMI